MATKLTIFLHWIASLAIVVLIGSCGSAETQTPESPNPILIELFTSEGCSSCPPADALLQKLDRSQPVHNAQLIVLSEHVDYWNHIGWRDPYSSHSFSERQSGYADRFELDSNYTPQMVVDGSTQFVGSDERSADQAIAAAVKIPKIRIALSNVAVDDAHNLRAHVELGSLSPDFGHRSLDIMAALVSSRAESEVSGGENSGRRLTHTNVVRQLVKIGSLQPGQNFVRDIQLRAGSAVDTKNVRVVVFVQEPDQGKVLGAAIQSPWER